MTNKERLEKYKKEHCCKCKNKDKELCDIRVFAVDKIIYTKCGFYEREQAERRKKKKMEIVTARQSKPLMKGLVWNEIKS